MELDMDYAVVNPDGTIQNVIVLDDVNAWTPPEGATLIPLPAEVGMAHTWDGTQFVAPPPPPEAPEEIASQEAPSVIG
jgi:hypothetical protein